MKTEMLIKVRKMFNVDYVPRHINRHNQLAYVRAMRSLGDKWLLAKKVQRLEGAKP